MIAIGQQVHANHHPVLGSLPADFNEGTPLTRLISWPAMRVISLGIRLVPVLPVAKKLAAPRRAPTAPVAKCWQIRQDEAELILTVDWVLKNFCVVVNVFFSSRSNQRGRELIECSKLTCIAKRTLHVVPGGQW